MRIQARIVLPIIAAASLVLTACAPKKKSVEIDMAAVVEANKTENLLKNYGSFTSTMYAKDVEYCSIYVDDEIYFYKDADGVKRVTGEDFQFVYENGLYHGNLLCDGNYNNWFANLLITDETADEKVLTAVDDGSEIIVTTELDEQQTLEIKDDFGEDYREGDKLRMKYRLISETLAMTSCTDELLHADGTTTPFDKTTVSFGDKRSDEAQEMLERAKPTADIRTMTVVLNPNTEDEQVFFKTVRKGDSFIFVIPDGYELYSDEACTVLYRSSEYTDTSAHVLLYANKIAE
ncbi:MAG: hypothetical protein ACI4JZ_08585 [Oscillospiraceae bacterium]